MIKFGTDGIRFVYDKEKSLLIIKAVSLSIKNLFPNNKFVIGNDGRNSGEDIEKTFLSSFNESQYERLGIVPSGCVAFIASQGFDYGVMITASHNDYRYNGIKFFDKTGQKISNELEKYIEIVSNKIYQNLTINDTMLLKIDTANSSNVDNESQFVNVNEIYLKQENNKLKQKYCDFIKGLLTNDHIKNKKIIIDCANGGASKIIKNILGNENEYHIINTYVKLNKINYNCGATHTDLLRKVVKANKAYLGIAFDGDADRMVVINKNGKQIDGAVLFGFFAENIELNNQQVVGTVYTNLGVINHLNRYGIKFVNGGVGDKGVINGMNKINSNFGGEPSGHYIFKDNLNTGDGLISFMKLLNLLGYEKIKRIKTFYEISKTINKDDAIFIKDKFFDYKLKELEDKFSNMKIIVRESGTEPIIRINVQCNKKNKAQECALIVEELVQNSLANSI